MSDPIWHKCNDCGHLWLHGEHGGHNCVARLKDQRDVALMLARQLRDSLNTFVEMDKAALGELAQFAPSYTPPTKLQTLHFKTNVILDLAKGVLG